MSDGPDGDPGLATARHLIRAPFAYRGKVRELYDLGEHWLIVVTDTARRYAEIGRAIMDASG